MCHIKEPTLEDCPVCKKESASMNSSVWEHDVMCCSDKCGEVLKHRLNELRSNEEMQKLLSEMNTIKKKIISELLEVAPNAGQFEIDRWVRWV